MLLAGGVALVLVISVSIYLFRGKGKDRWAEVKRGNIVEAIYGLGTVRCEKKFEIKTGVSSYIAALYVREGEKIIKGDKVIRFSDSNIVSSPINGIVSLVTAHSGEIVQPFQTIIQIEDLSSRYIEVSLEQEGVLKIKNGDTAIVVLEDFRNLKYKGIVSSIYSRGNEFLVHIEIPKMEDNILPGMTADISIEIGTSENVLTIPMASIRNGRVIKRVKNKKEKVEVVIGKVDESWAEVVSGNLNEGDEILIEEVLK